VETYLVINRVASLEAGIYHYQVGLHQLAQIKMGDFSRGIAAAALNQEMAAAAAVVFCWTGIFARSKWKYGQRAYRYIYLDAGHIAQNLALAAVGLGLGSCQVAALYDDEVNHLLGVDGQKESILYLSVVGHPYP
jgi:SagB-type dehydrogenase family enzyme